MTQAYNLSQLANKVNTSGQVDVTTGLNGVTPVANGGTGQSTFTDGQLLIGNTTGNTLTKATLTAGIGISVTNGNGSITIATTGGGQLSYALFSSGSSTWVCPSNVTKVKVTCIAGGGGGNIGIDSSFFGGAGGCAIGIYTVTPGAAYAYSVGSGGNGRASGAPTAINNGGSSSVSGLCSATGGTGASTTANGTSGTGSNGTFFNGSYQRNYMFSGVGASPSASGVAWDTTRSPGISGVGNVGGVGGVILIEYIG
jgi:hypothetical protein